MVGGAASPVGVSVLLPAAEQSVHLQSHGRLRQPLRLSHRLLFRLQSAPHCLVSTLFVSEGSSHRSNCDLILCKIGRGENLNSTINAVAKRSDRPLIDQWEVLTKADLEGGGGAKLSEKEGRVIQPFWFLDLYHF